MTTRNPNAHAGGGGDSPTGYLHGYSPAERDRLQRQARFLEPLVHGMRKELARAARDRNSVFFYAFIQARARAW